MGKRTRWLVSCGFLAPCGERGRNMAVGILLHSSQRVGPRGGALVGPPWCQVTGEKDKAQADEMLGNAQLGMESGQTRLSHSPCGPGVMKSQRCLVRDAPSDKVANLSLDTDADADAWDRGPPAQAFLVRGSWTSFRRTVISCCCCCCCIGRSKPVCWLRAGGVCASLHACELSSRGCAETERERQREAHNAAALRHVSRAASQRATGQRRQQQQRQVSFSLQPRTDASPHLLHSLSLFAFLVAPRRRGFSHEMRGRYIPHTVPGSVGAAAAAAASPEQDGMDDGRGSTASCPSQPQRQASSRAARPQSNTVVNWHGRVAR